MQLKPRKTKFSNFHKRLWKKNKKHSPYLLKFQNIKIISLKSFIIPAYLLDTVRKKLAKVIRKDGQLLINFFPHISKTKKPLEVRMGRGKGNVDFWGTKSYKGYLLFQIEGFSDEFISKFYNAIKYKLCPKKIYLSKYR